MQSLQALGSLLNYGLVVIRIRGFIGQHNKLEGVGVLLKVIPNKPPAPPAPGTVPDPISDWIKAGRWAPAEAAQADMVNAFKKENNMK